MNRAAGKEMNRAAGKDPRAGRRVVLDMRAITKEFPGVRALDGVSLTVHEGQVANRPRSIASSAASRPKIDGKTVTRRLGETEARLYQQWIDNDRQLRTLIESMRTVAAKATELIMKDTSSSKARV